MKNEEFFNIGLPKWPNLIITGEPVTEEQAKDIIFRTDSFLTDPSEYSGGNARQFNENYRRACGFKIKESGNIYQDMRRESEIAGYVRSKIGFVDLKYIVSDYASSCYVYGPYGFCSPEGEIYFRDNVGKWPSVEEIYEEFKMLAKAFPYLDMQGSLYDGEHCEEGRKFVLRFIVKNGKVRMSKKDVNQMESFVPRNLDSAVLAMNDRHEYRELGLPIGWYDEFANEVSKLVEEYKKENPE